MSFYIGTQTPDPQGNVRYFYALRRTDDGLLYFAKVDQLKDDDTVVINQSGTSIDDFPDFEYGVDFFDGRLEEDHSRPYTNLQWDQYRWDERNMFYYINENGEFIVRINKAYIYPPESIV